MKRIIYPKFGVKDKYELFKRNLEVLERTKEQYFGAEIGIGAWIIEHNRRGKPRDDFYAILKLEVENLLEGYNLEEMKRCMKSFGHAYVRDLHEWYGQFWELLYWRLFHDDEDFRPELMRHDIEALEQVEFGFRKDQ